MVVADQALDYPLEFSGAEYFPVQAITAPFTGDLSWKLSLRGSGGQVFADLFAGTGAKIYLINPSKNLLAEVLDEITTAFSLTKEELAQACKTKSRKTLYNWISGKTEPHKKNFDRIFTLLVSARDWKAAGYRPESSSIRRPVVGDQSVLDLLCSEEIDKDLIRFAGSRLDILSNKEATVRDPFA